MDGTMMGIEIERKRDGGVEAVERKGALILGEIAIDIVKVNTALNEERIERMIVADRDDEKIHVDIDVGIEESDGCVLLQRVVV